MHEFKKAKSQGTIRFRQRHENAFKKAKSSGSMGDGCRVTLEEFEEGLNIQQRVASAPVISPCVTPIKPGLYRKVDHVHNLDR